jgi:dihydroxy-acid dehydratase
VLAHRRASWKPAPARVRGWDRLVHEQVLQATEGADLAFLRPEGR